MSDDHVQVPDTERFLGVRDAACFLAVSRAFLYKYSKVIPHVRVGGPKSGKLLYKASELSAWAESRRVVPSNIRKAGNA